MGGEVGLEVYGGSNGGNDFPSLGDGNVWKCVPGAQSGKWLVLREPLWNLCDRGLYKDHASCPLLPGIDSENVFEKRGWCVAPRIMCSPQVSRNLIQTYPETSRTSLKIHACKTRPQQIAASLIRTLHSHVEYIESDHSTGRKKETPPSQVHILPTPRLLEKNR